MKAISIFATLLSIGGWVLVGLTVANLLSGSFDDRTCQTDCVQLMFFGSAAAGVIALLLGLYSALKSDARTLSWLSIALALPLCVICGAIVLIGTTA